MLLINQNFAFFSSFLMSGESRKISNIVCFGWEMSDVEHDFIITFDFVGPKNRIIYY